ncbi:phosphatase PAP2 family protein [Balneolaceae bacterium YR4-1]|uniref:Phosphatase PAP2 family protein n=1 Tax=Halalkalibaculum roseum TaxID=2709311 RepID=A0A6M1SKG7_9BACT|nr:phosphatase PAP2 family protein [Halalkalibaculum roseum]
MAQQKTDFSRFATWAKEDPVAMFQNITIQHAIGVGTAGLTFATLSTFDEPTSKNIQEHYRQSKFLNITNEFGNKLLILPASVALFGSSLFTDNTKFQDAAFTSLQSVLMTSLTVGAGKFIFARERPYMNEGAYDFEFMSPGQTSFPSGHTARAFSFITPWIMYYPGPVTYSLFALPAGTAIARIAKGKHWLSDVAAGAAIGFSMGYYLSKRHLGTQNIQVTPSFGKDLAALSINFEF